MSAPDHNPPTSAPVPPPPPDFFIPEAPKGWFFAPLVNACRRLRRKA